MTLTPMRFLSLLVLASFVAGCAADSTPDTSASGSAASAGAASSDADAGSPVVEIASAEALVDDLDGLDADWIVLNFWATWCGPCRQEFPELMAYGQEKAKDHVFVRFVSLDQPVDIGLVRAFLAEHEVTDPTYLYTGQGNVASQLNPFVADVLPITMFLDGDGILKHTHPGMITRPELDRVIATLDAGGDPSKS